MSKLKLEIYKEVLKDVSQKFEGVEGFIKQK